MRQSFVIILYKDIENFGLIDRFLFDIFSAEVFWTRVGQQ
jgi:hypothetical protein